MGALEDHKDHGLFVVKEHMKDKAYPKPFGLEITYCTACQKPVAAQPIIYEGLPGSWAKVGDMAQVRLGQKKAVKTTKGCVLEFNEDTQEA